MKSQPNANYVSNDEVQTPLKLARAIVDHFKPKGQVLEPCCGEGRFLDALRDYNASRRVERLSRVDWQEIKDGFDFLDQRTAMAELMGIIYYDWIITNPPWSLIRPFLQRSMEIADNVVFLMTVNHCWTKARVRDVKQAGFGLKEILLCDMPKEFPQSGFQLGAMHWQRGWKGDIKLSSL